MDSIPAAALPVLLELAPAFTQPTFRRAGVLLVAAVLTSAPQHQPEITFVFTSADLEMAT